MRSPTITGPPDATPDPSQRSWREIVGPYARPDTKRAVTQLLNTGLPFPVLVAALLYGVGRHGSAALPLALPAISFSRRNRTSSSAAATSGPFEAKLAQIAPEYANVDGVHLRDHLPDLSTTTSSVVYPGERMILDDRPLGAEHRISGPNDREWGLKVRRTICCDLLIGSSSYTGRISKMGDRHVRHMLYVAAQITLRREQGLWSTLKAWALKVSRSRGLAKVRVALARKLATVLHQMWVTGEPFRWQRTSAEGLAS